MVETREWAGYEKLYYSLWETAQRYGAFCEFRIIGKSHDERMIPMVEMGKGGRTLFCVGGLHGTDRDMPRFLAAMIREYAKAYECGWRLGEIYPVRELLDRVSICFVPLANPDGYEICRQGYGAIRNPVYRQMLRMQDLPHREFRGNARGLDVSGNFPAEGWMKRRIRQDPASENETRALIRIFQEYASCGLLSFGNGGKPVIFCGRSRGIFHDQKNLQLARHLRSTIGCSLKRSESGNRSSGAEADCGKSTLKRCGSEKGGGSDGNPKEGERKAFSGEMEAFYREAARKPAFRIVLPPNGKMGTEGKLSGHYQRIFTLPLEVITARLMDFFQFRPQGKTNHG